MGLSVLFYGLHSDCNLSCSIFMCLTSLNTSNIFCDIWEVVAAAYWRLVIPFTPLQSKITTLWGRSLDFISSPEQDSLGHFFSWRDIHLFPPGYQVPQCHQSVPPAQLWALGCIRWMWWARMRQQFGSLLDAYRWNEEPLEICQNAIQS